MQPTRAGSRPATSITSSRTAGLTANEPSAKRYSRRTSGTLFFQLWPRARRTGMVVAEDQPAGPAARAARPATTAARLGMIGPAISASGRALSRWRRSGRDRARRAAARQADDGAPRPGTDARRPPCRPAPSAARSRSRRSRRARWRGPRRPRRTVPPDMSCVNSATFMAGERAPGGVGLRARIDLARQQPAEMAAAVEGDHLPGHRRRLEDQAQRAGRSRRRSVPRPSGVARPAPRTLARSCRRAAASAPARSR